MSIWYLFAPLVAFLLFVASLALRFLGWVYAGFVLELDDEPENWGMFFDIMHLLTFVAFAISFCILISIGS